jgi:hypothetical protein
MAASWSGDEIAERNTFNWRNIDLNWIQSATTELVVSGRAFDQASNSAEWRMLAQVQYRSVKDSVRFPSMTYGAIRVL